jgi:serine/threonine-protein kinase
VLNVGTVAAFMQTLRQLQLLEPARYEEAARIAPLFSDPRHLARDLLTRNYLTAYQINQLFQGNGQDLVLGSYQILQRLGEGGMGRVFKASHRKLNRVVALKVLHKEYVDRPDAVHRFYQEIQASAQLSHPNLVFAFDADHVGEQHFLAMEYVDGVGLARLVDQAGPLMLEQACDYMRQAARGLQHAHMRGLVHRDIKPSNLLISKPRVKRRPGVRGREEVSDPAPRFGLLKVIDFGLARLRPRDDGLLPSRRLTRLGTVMGTPDFIAPEQAVDTATADIRSDLYSLGCTFYYLLTGRTPFTGGTLLEKLKQHESKEPPVIEKVSPAIPTELGDVVRKLMAKKPDQRYQTPIELATALDEFLRPGSRLLRLIEQKHPRDIVAELNLPGFFAPGVGSLSSTTIVGLGK